MKSLQDTIKELGLEHLFEDVDNVTPDKVVNQLNQTTKLDDVETEAYGLETDDGQIVKVYINKADTDKFDEIMQRVLGETDSIEDAINLIAKEIDVVDVVWPEEATDDSETGGGESDGDESLNPEVYKTDLQNNEDSMLKKADQTNEALVNEAHNTLESRFQTSNQKLIYHAIISLGVPEELMLRTPMRAVLLHRIKEKAVELNRNTVLKQALKNIVRKSSEFLDDIPDIESTPLSKLQKNSLDESTNLDAMLDRFMNIGPNSSIQEFLDTYQGVELYEGLPKGRPVAMFVNQNKKQFVLWQEGAKFILTSEQNPNGEHLKYDEWNGKSYAAVINELKQKDFIKTPASSYKNIQFKPVLESIIKAKQIDDEIELITDSNQRFNITESEARALSKACTSKKPVEILLNSDIWIVSNRLNETVIKRIDNGMKLKLSSTIINFIERV